MERLSLANPVFATYAIAASILILKMAAMSWLTIGRMIKINGGFRSPEDTKLTPFNKAPHADQLKPNDYVDRVRRVHGNDIENIPIFLVAALLFVLTDPSPLLAAILLYGYTATRILHSIAYLSARTHDLRAMLWTPGSLVLLFLCGRTLWIVLAR
jgi:glutathione S-transferase